MNTCEQALQKHKLCVHNTLSGKGWCVMCIQKVWEDEIIFKRMWSLIKMPFAPSDIGIYFPSWSILWGSGSIIVSKWNKLHIASNVHDSMNGVVLQAVHKNLLTSSVNPPTIVLQSKTCRSCQLTCSIIYDATANLNKQPSWRSLFLLPGFWAEPPALCESPVSRGTTDDICPPTNSFCYGFSKTLQSPVLTAETLSAC